MGQFKPSSALQLARLRENINIPHKHGHLGKELISPNKLFWGSIFIYDGVGWFSGCKPIIPQGELPNAKRVLLVAMEQQLNCKQVCRRNISLQINQGFAHSSQVDAPPATSQTKTKFLTLDLALHGGKQVAVKVVVTAAQMNLLTEILVQIGWAGGSAASTDFWWGGLSLALHS